MPTFIKVQLFWLGLSMTIPALCMAAVLTDSADPFFLSNVALVTVLGSWIIALATPFIWPNNASRAQRYTALIVAWSILAIVFPIGWDLMWAIFHDWVNGATADDKWKWYFWAYAVADTRFLKSDPLMIWVEYWSGLFGFAEIYALYHLTKNNLQKAYKAFVIVGFMQFYACSVFFGVEALQGLANIRPDIFSYIKFWGMNGMWVIVPAIAGYCFTQLIKDPAYNARETIHQLLGRTAKAA